MSLNFVKNVLSQPFENTKLGATSTQLALNYEFLLRNALHLAGVYSC